MRSILFLLSRYRAERGAMLLFALVVGITALLAGVAPRALSRVADDGLRTAVAGARSVERNLQLGQIGQIGGSTGTGTVIDAGDDIVAGLPDSIQRIIASRSYQVESANWSVVRDRELFPGWLRFRLGSGIDERITYVEGRPPTGATTTIPGALGTLPGQPEDATVFEVSLPVATAEELSVGVGDRMELIPDTDDVLVGQFSSPVRAAADVVGVYEVVDPADPFWLNDPALEQPTVIVISPDLQLIYGTALLDEAAYQALMSKFLPVRYSWRQYIDPARLDAGVLAEITSDLQLMLTQFPPFVTTLREAETTTLRTGLLTVLERFAGERRTVEAVLTTAALGPAAVAAAAVILLSLIMVQRRDRSAALARGRGASAVQWVGSHVVEGSILAVPAAALAAVLARLFVDARSTAADVMGPALVAVGAMVILVAVASLQARRRPGDTGVSRPLRRPGPRRIVAELFVIGLAVGGAFLLRERGLAGGGSEAQLTGADPLLAAVPALIGMAAGLLAARLYPVPLRMADWLSDGWRGSVPALGLRRAARSGEAGSMPLLVLLITVAIGSFSSTISVSIARGQEAAAWQQVGADVAVLPGSRPFPSAFDATELPGVELAAGTHAATAALGGRGGQRVDLHAIDLPAYSEVTAGTGADPRLPRAVLTEPSEEEPIPAILSRGAATEGPRAIRAGDEVELLVASRLVPIRVVEIRSSFPGIDPRETWLVVPLGRLESAVGRDLAATSYLLRAPGIETAALQGAMDEVLPATSIVGRADVLDRLRAGPLAQAVGAGFVVAVVVALAYAMFATTAALVLIARVRMSETAHLRTLGLSSRDVLALSVVEHGPAIVAATVLGVALGIGIAWFIAPGLGLAALIGSPVEVALVVEWPVVGALLASLLAVMVVAVAVSSRLGRGASLAGSARQGIE